jgi:hypothetical protein
MLRRFPKRAGRQSIGVFAFTFAVVACDPLGSGAVAEPAAELPVHVDSIFPIEEEIRRFRAELGDRVDELGGGARSRDSLVERFLVALEANDPAALLDLALSVEEFAYLYYPSTRYTRRPYELSPAIVWFQLQNYGSRGLTRALGRYGGRPLGSIGYRCHDEALVEDENRIWQNCVVERVDEVGEVEALSLFGAILERDGRFKFVNYGNRL